MSYSLFEYCPPFRRHEMERMKAVGPDAIATFVTGFTRLMDPNQRDVAVLLGCSAALLDEMPDIFARNQVC